MNKFDRLVHSPIRKAAYDIEKIADYVIGANNPGLSNVLYSASGQVREYAREWKEAHSDSHHDLG